MEIDAAENIAFWAKKYPPSFSRRVSSALFAVLSNSLAMSDGQLNMFDFALHQRFDKSEHARVSILECFFSDFFQFQSSLQFISLPPTKTLAEAVICLVCNKSDFSRRGFADNTFRSKTGEIPLSLPYMFYPGIGRKIPGISIIPGIFCDYLIFVVSTFMPLTVSSPSTGITMQLRPSIFRTSGVPVSFVFTLTVTVGVFNSNVLASERFS